jgi:hypothetical protein
MTAFNKAGVKAIGSLLGMAFNQLFVRQTKAFAGGLSSGLMGANQSPTYTPITTFMSDVEEQIEIMKQQLEDARKVNPEARLNVTIELENVPFRLKRNEVILGASRARRGTHQATGRGKVRTHGFVVSVPIVQGLRWRASFGSGQIKPEMKWVFNEEGVLWFTNQRIIFDGSNKNITIQLPKVLNLGFANSDASLFYLDIENGKDAMFNLQTSFSTLEYALIHLHLYDNDLDDWLTVSN